MTTKTSQSHSPLPWTLDDRFPHALRSEETKIAEAWGEASKGISSKANAQFIVRAVNNHESLLSACKAAQCDCTPSERMSGHKTGCWFPQMEEAITKAEADL